MQAAGVYSNDMAALGPVANIHAPVLLSVAEVPRNSLEETKATMRLREVDATLVSQGEVLDAVTTNERAVETVAEDVAPPWAAGFQDRLVSAVLELRNVMTACTLNRTVRRNNYFSLCSQCPRSTLIPLYKEVAGAGDALVAGILPPGVELPPPLVVAPAIRERSREQPKFLTDGGCFPGTVGELRALTHEQVLALVQYYNIDFMIKADDLIDERIRKIKEFLWESEYDAQVPPF